MPADAMTTDAALFPVSANVMTQPFRVAGGGRIHRDRPIFFTFDGRRYQGYVGDTLASALLANSVHLVGRSFKYHRPRGILTAGSEEPNALVTINRGAGRVTPNLRATQVELYDGLTARSQNRFPSLRLDIGAMAAPLLSAGFYHKSFIWPLSFWNRFHKPAIRATAGQGQAPSEPDPDSYLHHHAHCDVLVIGGGAAGLAAALGAAAAGERVILCDEQAEPGGSLLHEPSVTIDRWSASDWTQEAVAALRDKVTMLPRTTAFRWYSDNMIGLVQRVTDHVAEPEAGLLKERLWQVRAKRVVLALGAIERPLTFPQNDRPGIMLAEAARVYLHRYGVKVGKRVLITTSGDSAYRAATDLYAAGVAIAGIVDQRPSPNSAAVEAARACGIPIHPGMTIGSTKGRVRVRSATLADGSRVRCDTILMSGGWTPSVSLFNQSRGKLLADTGSDTCLPSEGLPSEGMVGACAGVFDLATCLRDGTMAGGNRPRSFAVTGMPAMARPELPSPGRPHRLAFVDFQNDITTKDLATATKEGFVSIEHVKHDGTAEMATDQGKTTNLNTLTEGTASADKPAENVGSTTFLSPSTPVTFGALAEWSSGALGSVRLPPIAASDAVQEDAGGWKRARCFPVEGETISAAVIRECLAVRNDVGMLDASTLGKMEVAGPDAAAFLTRICTGDFTNLAPGRCRYTLLLGEDGFIRDDGIVARLDSHRFHVTTSTGGAAFVLRHMEDYLRTEFSALRVWLTPITEQWAVIAVQGPRSAEVLGQFIPDIDLTAMPHMSVREGQIDNLPIRIFRVSFSGESGFEVNLPSEHAQRLWDTLREQDVTPCGTDAMNLLRAEKGYINIGQETDGTVTPDDVALGWTVGEADFVGKRSLSLPDLKRRDRKQLIGLLPVNPAVVLEEGAPVMALPGPPVRTHTGTAASDMPNQGGSAIGRVTSSYHSPAFGRSFALALVEGGRWRIGAKLRVPTHQGDIDVTVTEPVFLDKAGDRLRALLLPRVRTRAAAQPLLPVHPRPTPVARPCGSVQLVALAPTVRISIRAGPAASAAIGLALDVQLPTAPRRSVIAHDRAALCLGPDEWLVIAPDTASDLVAQATKATDCATSIVDVSSRSRMLEISGSQAVWCLNGFCALDLDGTAFPVGTCTRTLLGKAEVVLWRIAAEVFHLDVARSFLPYVWACLEEARLEFVDVDVVSDQ